MDRTAIKQLISRLIAHFGITYTTHIPDQLKTLGSQQATQAAISLGIDDPLTAPSKGWPIQDAEQQGYTSEKHHRYGNVHAVEKLRQLIETRYATSEYLKQEMNPNFRMTDPLNPVHMMSFPGARGSTSQVHQLVGMRGSMSDPQGQIIDLPIQSNSREGLSLTEYIISRYGARKGVVDTAARTSDAGYPTRRPVEVVQHIVVRKNDCGTVQGISVSPLRDKKRDMKTFGQQKLIGRVLADNVYMGGRCVATRNQDIAANPANYSITYQTKSISIRSPSTRKSMLWIRQSCYGWSLTHGNLVELGEAVGIIAGQSIGEPGTQLTLRTFHTGGVFTGDIAEHVRTPFNGTIKFDTDLVYPTRTRHGHPAWICHNQISVIIESRNKIHNLMVPPQSVLLVQNNQYVESKQVIAEIRAKVSPFKEKIQKYIYSDLEGEMHWSTKVRHVSGYVHSNVHLILTTGHVRILSGSSYKYNGPSFIFYQDQDKIDVRLPIAKQISNYSNFEHNLSNKNKKWNFIYSSITFYAYSITQINERGKTLFYFRKEEGRYEKKSLSQFTLRMKKNGILRNNDIFAILDDPKYRIRSSGTIKYGDIKIDWINKRNEIFRDRKTQIFEPRYEIIKGGNFFFLPEEVHISHQSPSSILVENNGITQAGTKITSTINSRIAGLVRMRKKTNNSFEIRILPGSLYYPRETHKFSKQNGTLVPPGEIISEEFQSDNWVYLQWISLPEEKSFFSVRPAIEYKISDESDESNLPTPSLLLDLLKEQENLRIKTIEYMLYEDGEEVQIINDTGTQLVQTCLALNRETDLFEKEAYASFTKIRMKKIVKNFLQINLIKYPISDIGKENTIILKSLFNNINPYASKYFNGGNQLFSKHQGTIRILSNKNQEGGSFPIPSPFNLFKTSLFNDTERYVTVSNGEKRSDLEKHPFFYTKISNRQSEKNSNTPIDKKTDTKLSSKGITKYSVSSTQETKNLPENIGLLGHLQNITKFVQPFHLMIYNQLIFIQLSNSIIDNLKNIYQNPKWYFIDENKKFHKLLLGRDILFNSLNWSFPLFSPSEKNIRLINLGQFFCEGLSISEYQPFYESGQVVAINTDYLVIRLAKPYPATGGATVHSHYGEIIKGGDTSITLIYERLKSGDIIQGLPKVEQLLEARPINSISINLERGFEDWNRDVTKFFGSLWGFFLSARISMEQSQINLVDQIQRVYRSQAVQISDRHVEIIVRQMTSKVLTLEDGMANGSSPGEPVEFSRAQRMNRALEEVVPYKPILLGITKASLNTQSFISEASSQETTRVLARAALRGRIDWLKGLKENVILGGIVPAGTGCQEVIWQMTLEKRRKKYLRRNKTKLFHNKVKDLFLYEKLSASYTPEAIHRKLKQQFPEGDQ